MKNTVTDKLREFYKENVHNEINNRIVDEGRNVIIMLNWGYQFTIKRPTIEQWIIMSAGWNPESVFFQKIPQVVRDSKKFRKAHLIEKLKRCNE